MTTFKKEKLLGILGNDYDEYKIIENEIVDHRRWVIVYKLIFKDINNLADIKYYQVFYQIGATEYQDESPWEFDGEDIEVTEVKPFERTVIDFKPI